MSLFVLAAGGTGGHLFPAQALAGELIARGHRVVALTDRRALAYAGDFHGATVETVPSAAFSDRSLGGLIKAPFEIVAGIVVSRARLRRLRPAAVIGFGGYPSLPVMLAAGWLGCRTAVVTPDALMGRANRVLANMVERIAANFPLKRFFPKDMAKVVYTGNPLRAEVVALAASPYDPPCADGKVRLLIFGGSQGARYFSQTLPQAVACLPKGLRGRLAIVQQCRKEDLDATRTAYDGMGIDAECAPFFADLPARIARAHLVVARAGAGTVSELAAIGRPAILVPLPHALDDNQTPNAEALVDAGGGWCRAQKDLTAESLAALMAACLADPSVLAAKAAAALTLGKPRATEALADLAEDLGNGK